MIIRAAGDEIEAAREQGVGQRLGVFHGLGGVIAEGRLHRLAEADRLGGDDVHQRAALRAGEDAGVHFLGKFLLAQDHAAARAAQGLVSRGGDNVGIGHGALVLPARDQTGNVRHVDHEQRAVAMGNVGEFFKIERADRPRRRPAGCADAAL